MNNYTPEQVAKQAAKNDSDFVSQTNQALQNLQWALNDIKKSLDVHLAEDGSKRKSFEIAVENLDKHITENFNDAKHLVEGVVQDCDGYIHDLDMRIKALESDHVTKQRLFDFINGVDERLLEFTKKYDFLYSYVCESLQKISSGFSKEIQSARQEILSKPSDAPSIKKDLEDKISIVGMDSSNANIRTANCEKAILLIEKKIENIFLLLKKLELDK